MALHNKKYALCLKDGFMQNGRQFCVKNKVYEYSTTDGPTLRYNVKSEASSYPDHGMTSDFFLEYFLEDWKLPETIPLAEDLFEI